MTEMTWSAALAVSFRDGGATRVCGAQGGDAAGVSAASEACSDDEQPNSASDEPKASMPSASQDVKESAQSSSSGSALDTAAGSASASQAATSSASEDAVRGLPDQTPRRRMGIGRAAPPRIKGVKFACEIHIDTHALTGVPTREPLEQVPLFGLFLLLGGLH